MNILAMMSLFAWLPAVVAIFASYPPRRAVVIAFIVAWLLIPQYVAYPLPGLPDYTKMSATVIGVMLSSAIFDAGRFLRFRPRWYDLPMVLWVCWPFLSCMALKIGAYGGASEIVKMMFSWGFPYLIGRVYLCDAEGVKNLARGIVIGGLAYVPGCLIEIRLSPRMAEWVYGIHHFEPIRYGGFRPKMFLSSGLELGMWMTMATLVAFQIWSSGGLKRLWGYSFGMLTLGMAFTTLLCKSTGSLLLLVMGVGALIAVRVTKSPWLVLLLVAIAPGYTITRTLGYWSGQELLGYAKVFGADRVQSIEFRMQNEDMLIRRAMLKPIFGWGRYGDAQVRNAEGKIISVYDGYWIITLATDGLPNLLILETMFLLPMFLLIRRQPGRTWTDPEVAPAAGLAVILVLVMIDNVSNAMHNPIYPLVMGALMGLPVLRRADSGSDGEAEAVLSHAASLAAEGLSAEAEPEFRHALDLVSSAEPNLDSRITQAEALEGLAGSLKAMGHLEEAAGALRGALDVREYLAIQTGEAARQADAAMVGEELARHLAGLGRVAEAVRERGRALAVWDRLAVSPRAEVKWFGRRVDALNDLAWLLAAEADLADRDPDLAVGLALEATRVMPERGDCWNTLGVARYRSGDWAGAIKALDRSASFDASGGTAFDDYFRAMASHYQGESDLALDYYRRAVDWSEHHCPDHPALGRFRNEAIEVLTDPTAIEFWKKV